MAESKQPQGSPGRKDRLREALRENLKRRKAQARGRGAAGQPDEGGAHDSAGFVRDEAGDKPQNQTGNPSGE